MIEQIYDNVLIFRSKKNSKDFNLNKPRDKKSNKTSKIASINARCFTEPEKIVKT